MVTGEAKIHIYLIHQYIMYYFIQYFERHCLSLSECYKLWLSEAGMLQFKEEEVEI